MSTNASGVSPSQTTWHFDTTAYNFQPHTAPRIPRAWDRAPKASFAPQHQGRKVWKRYDLRSKKTASEHSNDCCETKCTDGCQCRRGSAATNALRPVKRLCLNQAPLTELKNYKHNSTYITTLRDVAQGTPRRKLAKRKSLRLRESHIKFGQVEQRAEADLATNSAANNDARPFEALSDTGHHAQAEIVTRSHKVSNSRFSLQPVVLIETLKGAVHTCSDAQELHEKYTACYAEAPMKLDVANPESLDISEPTSGLGVIGIEPPVLSISKSSPYQARSKQDANEIGSRTSANLLMCDENGGEQETMSKWIISNDDTAKRPELCSPEQLDSLEWTQDPNLIVDCKLAREMASPQLPMSCDAVDLEPSESPESTKSGIAARVLGSITAQESGNATEDGHTNCEGLQCDKNWEDATGRQDETHDEAINLQPILGVEESKAKGPESDSRNARTHDGNNEAHKVAESLSAHKDIHERRTRSGARFSDETSMLLKDFLNRAQARKAAKVGGYPHEISVGSRSPRRSPRKILGQLDSNFPSPQRESGLARHLGLTPKKPNKVALDFDDVDELGLEHSSCRRSARIRLTTPSTVAASAPSFIPIRRPDGTDPVVLQKSVAQELAIVTRTNTKRNKGQSKPPSLMLQSLVVKAPEMAHSKKHEKESTKTVDWDTKLVYYEGVLETKEETFDVRQPKVRRLKGLGATNGTPAPRRKAADVHLPNRISAPNRRGKVK